MTAFQPASVLSLLVSVQPRAATGVKAHGDVVGVRPVEKGVIGQVSASVRKEPESSALAARSRLPSSIECTCGKPEQRQVAARREEGAFAVRVVMPTKASCRPLPPPVVRASPERLLQPGAELIVADIGRNHIIHAERIPRKSVVPAQPHGAVRHDRR